MNHERQNRDIHVKIGSEWIPISTNSTSEEFKQYAIAYTQYKNRPIYNREIAYEADTAIRVYREDNDHYKPIFISHRQRVFSSN